MLSSNHIPIQRKRKLEENDEGIAAEDARKKRKLNTPSPNNITSPEDNANHNRATSTNSDTIENSPSISSSCDEIDKENHSHHPVEAIHDNPVKIEPESAPKECQQSSLSQASSNEHNPYIPFAASSTDPSPNTNTSDCSNEMSSTSKNMSFPPRYISTGIVNKADSVESGEIISDDIAPVQHIEQSLTVRLLLDAKHVGRLIGEGGCVITRIREESGAKIHIAKHVQHSLFRICTLIGDEQQIQCGIKLVVDTIAERALVQKVPSHQITILIEDKNTGNLIGKKGTSITEIRNNTNANIYISSHLLQRSSEKTVDICGEKEDVHTAIEMIIHRLFANKSHVETRMPYDPGMQILQSMYEMYEQQMPPLRYMPIVSDNAPRNMYPPPSAAPAPPPMTPPAAPTPPFYPAPHRMHPPPQNIPTTNTSVPIMCNSNFHSSDSTATVSNLYVPNVDNPQNNYSHETPFPFEERCNELYHMNTYNNHHNNNYPQLQPLSQPQPPPLPLPQHAIIERASYVLPVPSDLIGAVIGRGGRNIQDIRRRSNARIVIDNEDDNKTKDRYISIQGSRKEISTAIYMIQSSLATHT